MDQQCASKLITSDILLLSCTMSPVYETFLRDYVYVLLFEVYFFLIGRKHVRVEDNYKLLLIYDILLQFF